MVMWASFGELVIPFLLAVLFGVFSPAAMPWTVVVIFVIASFAYFAIKYTLDVSWTEWFRIVKPPVGNGTKLRQEEVSIELAIIDDI